MPFSNLLLKQLDEAELAALGFLEPVELALHDRIEEPGQTISFVYFPEGALLSVVGEVKDRGPIELGMIGFEGVSALALILGASQSPFVTMVQGAGPALRVRASSFQDALCVNRHPSSLLRFAQAFAVQVGSTAMANGSFKLEERLARWLLMAADRLGSKYSITHEYIAIMLAVRRSGVTLALQVLEGNDLIISRRGLIEIVNRDGLIEVAGGSYGLAELEYERLLAHHPLFTA